MKNYSIPIDIYNEIRNRNFECNSFSIGNKEYQCHSKTLFYLLSDSPDFENVKSGQMERVKRGEVLDIYANAYDNGVSEFKKTFPSATSDLYLINPDTPYFAKLDNDLITWKSDSEAFHKLVRAENIEKMGRNSGLRFAYESIRQGFLIECDEISTDKFNSQLSDDCLIQIMQHLVKQKQLPDTDVSLWLYWFNRKTINKPTQLIWNGTPTMLANVMSHFCGTYQTVAAKAAIKDVKTTKPSVAKYEKTEMYKAINQIITMNK